MGMEDENIFKDGVQTPLFSPESKIVVSSEEEDPESQQIPIDEEKEEEEEIKDNPEKETAAQPTEHGIFIPFPKGQPRDLGNNNDPGTEYEEARTRRKARKH